jgi:protein tyrosine phosphatase (PTP) superfamily phosphohydrolase (DUF442 family)
MILRTLTCFSLLLFATSTFAADGDPKNLVQWRPGLTSSAQPDVAYLKRAKAIGYDMVINIAPPEYAEAVANEGAIVAAQGITYVNIPVKWSDPSPEDFRVFTEILKNANKKNVLVHCQINLRGSSFTFLYRVLSEGASIEESRAKVLSVWVPEPTWKKFISGVLAGAGKKVDFD